jgi:hypothetical protein
MLRREPWLSRSLPVSLLQVLNRLRRAAEIDLNADD